MKQWRMSLWAILVCFPLLAAADDAPSKVKAALKTMYPQVTNPVWSTESSCFVANFTENEYETEVWLDSNGNWIMTLTDLETADALPANVYNAFSMGNYAAEQVEDVTQATFPKCATVIVIKVGQQNLDFQYQLFYTLNGALIQTTNVGYTQGNLHPKSFNCN